MPEIEPIQEFSNTEDVEHIANEIGELHKHPEHKEHNGKEMVKEVLRTNYELEKPTAPTPQVQSPNLPDYMENATDQEKQEIEELVNLSLTGGIKKAIQKAKQSHNPFVIDAFHDAIVDKLYDELVKKGVIKE